MNPYEDHVLNDYLDGDLDAADREALEGELRHDLALRRRLAELEEVRSALAALPKEARVPDRVWQGVAARLDEAPREVGGGIIQLTPAAARDASRARRHSFTVPQLAAAALALVSLGSAVTWAATSGGSASAVPGGSEIVQPAALTPPVRSPGDVLFAEYEASADQLMAIVEAGDSLLSEETVTVLRESLDAIDTAVEEALIALDEDPGSDMLLRILQFNMEKKIDLLRQTAEVVQGIA